MHRYRPEGSSDHFRPHAFGQRVYLLNEPTVPKILISRDAFARMWLYVDIAKEEVGWMGTVKQLPGGEYYIEKVWLLRQEVTGVETLITTDGLSELAQDFLSRGDEGLDDWDKLRFWGHSHVLMATHPSATDQEQMRLFKDAEHPWFLRGILNKLGRIEFTLYLYEQGLVVEDAAWMVVDRDAAHESDTSISAEAKEIEPVADFTGFRPFANVFARNYEPDVNAALRAEVQTEFDAKVTSRGWTMAMRYRSRRQPGAENISTATSPDTTTESSPDTQTQTQTPDSTPTPTPDSTSTPSPEESSAESSLPKLSAIPVSNTLNDAEPQPGKPVAVAQLMQLSERLSRWWQVQMQKK